MQLDRGRAVVFVLIFTIAASAVADAQDGAPPRQSGFQPQEVSLRLERTICFGTCPVYQVTILGDGTVKYMGTQFVGVEGGREDKVRLEDVARLLNEFLRVRFFDAADTYDGGEMVELRDGRYVLLGMDVTDLPSQILTLQLGARKKRVVLRYNYPSELGKLPNLVDDVAQTKRWTTQKK